MLPSEVQREKDAADVFMPTIKAIMGRVILVEPTLFEDQDQNTDLKVFVARGTRIGVRMRRHIGLQCQQNLKLYGHQFTIRLDRPRGGKTELEKIAEGWGDWFFYGFGDFATAKLLRYYVIDLDRFRKRLIVNNPPVVFDGGKNGDKSSTFRAYDVASFDSSVIVKHWRVREAA